MLLDAVARSHYSTSVVAHNELATRRSAPRNDTVEVSVDHTRLNIFEVCNGHMGQKENTRSGISSGTWPTDHGEHDAISSVQPNWEFTTIGVTFSLKTKEEMAEILTSLLCFGWWEGTAECAVLCWGTRTDQRAPYTWSHGGTGDEHGENTTEELHSV